MREEDYRQYRGEGVVRLTETWTRKAADLSKWFRAVWAMSPRAKAEAKAKALSLAKAPLPAQPAAVQSAPVVPAQPLPLPGTPVNQEAHWGCSRCRWSVNGCSDCNPEKASKKADKWAALELPAAKRRRQG